MGLLAVFYCQTTMLPIPIYSLTFILGVVCTIFYYRAGEYENSSGVVWAGLSAVISLVLWTVAHVGFLGTLLGQVGLFAGLTLWRCRGK